MRKPLATLWDALLARSGVIAYLPIIFVTILMFSGSSWQIFWPTSDAARYQCYALTFWFGSSATKLLPLSQCLFLQSSTSIQAPLHMLPLEYPPLTLLLFSLALLAPIAYYQLLFALWMALTSVLIYWLLLRYGPRRAGLTFALYALIGAWATAEGRFDLVPAALTLLCVIAADHKRWTFAYIALAFGVLLKLYPLLLLPALFIAEQQYTQRFYTPAQSLTLKTVPIELWRTLRGALNWRWKNSLIFFGILLGVTGVFAIIDFQGAVVTQLSYFAQRPVQIESTGSTFLRVATLFGFPAYTEFSYGSLNIVSPLGNSVSLLFDIAFVLGYAYTLWLKWRGKLDILQAFIAILLVFIATGKVFSPQYLIWLIPLLAYSSALDALWLLCWGSVSVLTTIIYPYFYTHADYFLYIPDTPGFAQVVAVRDALFVLVALAYLFNWFHLRRRKPLPGLRTRRETRPLYNLYEQEVKHSQV